jgi:UDP-N-acetylmuramoyl-tripeptide--D-alanyl-D-alanine ligase
MMYLASSTVVALLVALAWSVVRAIRALHMLQLDGYSNARFLIWLRSGLMQRLIVWEVAALLISLGVLEIVVGVMMKAPQLSGSILMLWVVGGGLVLLLKKRETAKKVLVYTGRAKRILAVAVFLLIILSGAGSVVAYIALRSFNLPVLSALIVLGSCLILTQFAFAAVVVANLMLVPVQAAINRSYLRQAKRQLAMRNPTVIGITGSYGKTSTKHFVATILQHHSETLMTPHSYNTLLGVCRTINEILTSVHKIFVVEMGAYRRGDIRDLCELVHPRIGILTAIGPQHLERFKTLENIERTKYELIQSLPSDGIAIFNADDERCARLANATSHVRVVRYGTLSQGHELDVWAEDVIAGPAGTDFTVALRDGRNVKARTKLIGRHNVSNILAAVCVAIELKMDVDTIAAGIAELEPAPHRLQLVSGSGGVAVIDDSYNSNPLGAAAALEALGAFKRGRRVLVTPGMVELGTLQEESNEQLGRLAATVCDYVVLVGREQTAAIQRGLAAGGLVGERVQVVSTLSDATAWLKGALRPGDTVLFENDLPDLYTDKA